jgi:hypothetical protein
MPKLLASHLTYVVSYSWRSEWNPNRAEVTVGYAGPNQRMAKRVYDAVVSRAGDDEEGEDQVKMETWKGDRCIGRHTKVWQR